MWKKIPNTDFYYASEDGQIKSVDHPREVSIHGKKAISISKGKVLKQTLNSYGYPCVGIRFIGQKQKVIAVHRLIALTFLPSPKEGQTQINHIDGNKENNNVSNLEWCTPSENLLHAFKLGLNKGARPWEGKFGSAHPNSIPIIMCDMQGNELREFQCISQVKRELGLSDSHISSCLKGTRKSCGGYKWKRKVIDS